jgi:hypothetical protein
MIQITVTLALVGFIARHDAATQGAQPAEKSGDKRTQGGVESATLNPSCGLHKSAYHRPFLII